MRGPTDPAGQVQTLLAASEADDRLTRSITRQMIFVVGAALLLAATFLMATTQAVNLIDQSSIEADTKRAHIALRQTIVLDQEALAAIAVTYQLEGARLSAPADVAKGEISVPTGAADGLVLAWIPQRFGSDIFETVAPLRISAALCLLLAIGLAVHRLHRLARHLDAQRGQARRLAGLDPLTGVANRLAFNDRLQRRIAGGEGAALVLLDLDGFKAVNDSLGHVAGDAVLREIAARLNRLAGEDDVVARLGGDEFALIRGGGTGHDELAAFAAVLARALSAPLVVDGLAVGVTASMGIARIPQDAADAESAMRRADAALYRAKREAGNRHAFAADGAATPPARAA